MNLCRTPPSLKFVSGPPGTSVIERKQNEKFRNDGKVSKILSKETLFRRFSRYSLQTQLSVPRQVLRPSVITTIHVHSNRDYEHNYLCFKVKTLKRTSNLG